MNNGRPLSNRKAARLLVALTLLAWATQTLLHQWGYGAVVAGDGADESAVAANSSADVGDVKFVTGGGAGSVGMRGTLELRPDATLASNDVKLGNICRWSDGDAGLFASVADLAVAHLSDSRPYAAVTVVQVRQRLAEAGLNVAAISFSGATRCAVTRAEGFISPDPVSDAALAPTTEPSGAGAPPSQQLHSLRDLLKQDLVSRLQVSEDSLQVTFNSADDNVLNLVEPYFQFSIHPRQARNLGDISWSVDIVRDGQTQRVTISANAREWQTQAILQKPLDYRQIIEDGDVVEKRVLVDRLPDEALLARTQAVGMQASRVLKPGMVLTGQMVDPVPLAKMGQLITVSVTRGMVRVTTVARALEPGSFGETIRVRDESSPPQIYDVTLTGPQQGTLSAAN